MIWNLCVSIMNNHLHSIIMHDALHELRQEKGIGKSTLKEKSSQQITGMYHEPLLQVFLDVKKAYDSLDR